MIGDPTEGSLLVAAGKAGFDLREELAARPKIYELPFESVRKRMSVDPRRGRRAEAPT